LAQWLFTEAANRSNELFLDLLLDRVKPSFGPISPILGALKLSLQLYYSIFGGAKPFPLSGNLRWSALDRNIAGLRPAQNLVDIVASAHGRTWCNPAEERSRIS
jgi:hypothetical protein